MNNCELLALTIKEALAQCKHQEISYLINEDDINSDYRSISFKSRYNDSITNKLFRFSIIISKKTLEGKNWRISVEDNYKTVVLIPKEGTVNGWNHNSAYGGYVQFINVGKGEDLTDKMIFVRPIECNGADLVTQDLFGLFSFYTKIYTRKPMPIKMSCIKVEVEE